MVSLDSFLWANVFMCYRLEISTNCLDKKNDMKFDECSFSIVLLTLIQLQIWLIEDTT